MMLMHLWLGLVFGLPLALVSLAGIPITYWTLTEQLTAPAFYPAQTDKLDVSFRQAVSAARSSTNDATLTSFYVVESGSAVHVKFHLANHQPHEVAVSLETGKVLGARNPKQAPVMQFYDFHTRFWVGETGAIVVLILAAILTATTITGMIVWWPHRKSVLLALKPKLRRGRRFRDIHTLAGVYTLLPIILASVTALVLAWPTGKTAPTFSTQYKSAGQIDPAVFDTAKLALAEKSPPLRLRSLTGLDGTQTLLSGVADTADDFRRVFWRIQVHRDTGNIAAMEPISQTSMEGTLRDLHVGTFAGEVGRAIMAIAALVPTVLLITGVTWWTRRRRR